MKYRRFGRTGLKVSELVLGGGWVGGILIHQDDATRREAIRRALAAGINWIDTAPSYGRGESERALGWLLQEVPQRPHLSTKVAVDPRSSDSFDTQIEASLRQSLERLRIDSVDLFQLHNPIRARSGDGAVSVDDVLREGGIADALDRFRTRGLFNYSGITALGEAAACSEVIRSGRFDSAQVYYNLLNPSAGRDMPPAWSGQSFNGILAACKDHDVAVMCIRVLAAGVLATEERSGREVVVADDSDVAVEEGRARAIFAALGDAWGTRSQTAIRFALSNPGLACVVVGLAELAHLDEALGAADLGPLPEDALGRLDTVWRTNFGYAHPAPA